MTMPPHMNCAHSETGWCLPCVIALDAELRDSDEKFAECIAWMNKVADGANQLCGHCKEPFTNGTVAEHIRQCDANPLVAELVAARARLAALELDRDHWQQAAEADRDHWRRTDPAAPAELDAALAALRAAAESINNDYRPTCYSAPYGNGCAGADAESVAFWRAAVTLAEAPMPDCHGTGAYCKGPCVRHGTLVDPEAA